MLVKYAKVCIGERWPEAEPIIINNINAACEYACNNNFRWKEIEPDFVIDISEFMNKKIVLFLASTQAVIVLLHYVTYSLITTFFPSTLAHKQGLLTTLLITSFSFLVLNLVTFNRDNFILRWLSEFVQQFLRAALPWRSSSCRVRRRTELFPSHLFWKDRTCRS